MFSIGSGFGVPDENLDFGALTFGDERIAPASFVAKKIGRANLLHQRQGA